MSADTATIAAQVVADANSGAIDASPEFESTTIEDSADASSDKTETGAEAETETVTESAGTAQTAPQQAETAKPQEQADEDSFEALQAKDERGRTNRIPYDRVQRIVERAKQTVQTEWEGKLAEHTERLSAYEQEFQAMAVVEHLMRTNPEEFLARVAAQVNPAFQRYLQPAQTPVPEGRPEPDAVVDIGNGQRAKTYSQQGLEKLMAWERAQAVAEAEQRMMQRLQPIEQQHVAAQRRAAAAEQVNSMLTEAATWPQFKENEAGILAALKADKSLDLRSAYLKVVLPKLTADRNKVREEVLQELKTKPASTSASTRTAGTAKEPRSRTTADVAAEVVRELSR